MPVSTIADLFRNIPIPAQDASNSVLSEAHGSGRRETERSFAGLLDDNLRARPEPEPRPSQPDPRLSDERKTPKDSSTAPGNNNPPREADAQPPSDSPDTAAPETGEASPNRDQESAETTDPSAQGEATRRADQTGQSQESAAVQSAGQSAGFAALLRAVAAGTGTATPDSGINQPASTVSETATTQAPGNTAVATPGPALSTNDLPTNTELAPNSPAPAENTVERAPSNPTGESSALRQATDVRSLTPTANGSSSTGQATHGETGAQRDADGFGPQREPTALPAQFESGKPALSNPTQGQGPAGAQGDTPPAAIQSAAQQAPPRTGEVPAQPDQTRTEAKPNHSDRVPAPTQQASAQNSPGLDHARTVLARLGLLAGTDSTGSGTQAESGDTGSQTPSGSQPGSSAPQPVVGKGVSMVIDRPTPAGIKSETSKEPSPTAIEQVVRVVRAQIGERQSHARLQLQPPELGQLRIDVRITGKSVQIHIQSQTQVAHQMLQARAGELRQALESQGLNVERTQFEIREPSQSAQSHARHDSTDAHTAARDSHSETGSGERGHAGAEPNAETTEDPADGIEPVGLTEKPNGEIVAAETRVNLWA